MVAGGSREGSFPAAERPGSLSARSEGRQRDRSPEWQSAGWRAFDTSNDPFADPNSVSREFGCERHFHGFATLQNGRESVTPTVWMGSLPAPFNGIPRIYGLVTTTPSP